MKQQVLEWYNRNKFHYWQIENSKGKTIAVNTPNKVGKKPDENGEVLSIELDALERLNFAERYQVAGMEKNGDSWQYFPFQTYASMPSGSTGSGGFPLELAMMLGRMQAEQTVNPVLWQLQQEKAERERKEQEKNGLQDIINIVKPLAPALVPMLFQGVLNMAQKSPQIQAFLEKVTSNPGVQSAIEQMLINSLANQQNASTGTSTDFSGGNDETGG